MSVEKLDITPLWSHPLSEPDDLGKLIPPTPLGISVCLPSWQDTIDYEKGGKRVLHKLRGGYPRFVYSEPVQHVFDATLRQFGNAGEQCQVYPSLAASERCAEFVTAHSGASARVHQGIAGTWAVFFEVRGVDAAKAYWCHSGEGIVSRHAQAILDNRQPSGGADSMQLIKDRLASVHDVDPSQVFIFPNGMSAIWTAMRFCRRVRPETETIQFGFPYVDTLKLQERTGTGHRFFPMGNTEDIDRVERLVSNDQYCALFCEAPSNPLLISSDIGRLSSVLRESSTPFVVDDTLAACGNLEILPHCDIVATSLTKYFSGIGDVMGGALIINPASPWAETLATFLATDDHSEIWCEDLQQLELNSRSFRERIEAMNRNASVLADYLQSHPAVRTVYYPKFTNRDQYDQVRNVDGGFGGLLSFTLKNEQQAPLVFDNLKFCKGPNLGMEYTLVCPFTLLAHYDELAFVERCGLSPWLIRVSVGLETTDELIGRFDQALRLL